MDLRSLPNHAHTPGTLRVIEQHLPEVKSVLAEP